MKKVLIITYSFPPSNNVAIHRVLRMGKWLPLYGWEPIVLTPEHGFMERIDNDNLMFVHKYFNKVYRCSSRKEKILNNIANKSKRNPIARLVRWQYLYKLQPDKSIVWKAKAFEEGLKIIKKEKINAIWATIGPPTTGLIAAELKRMTGLPLLVDYRDPWTLNHYRDFTTKKRQKNIASEKNMLSVADAVITTSRYIKETIVNNDYFDENKTFVITNSYDEELQWMDDKLNDVVLNKNMLNITYTGAFYRDRQPFSFIDGLKIFLENNPQYKNKVQFNIIGNQDLKGNINKYSKKEGLENIIFERGLVSYRLAMRYLQQSDILLLVNGTDRESKIFIPGKLFDYMVTKKPILFIGDGQPKEIINELSIGETVIHDPESISVALKSILQNPSNYISKNSSILNYSSKFVTKNLVSILNNL